MSYKEIAEMEHVGDATDILKTIAQTAGQAYADKVRIQTTISDDTVKPFAKDNKPGSEGFIAKVLRPKFTVFDSTGKEETSMAPYGEPGAISGLVKVGGIALGLGYTALVFGAGRASKNRWK
jgi:hypothetical protein